METITDNTDATIMVVDDKPTNLTLLEDILTRQGYQVKTFQWAKVALRSALSAPPDLILLDINMPVMNGFEFCSALKSHRECEEIPILFISGIREMDAKVKAFKQGGVDYITKPFRVEEVKARIRTHLKIHLLQEALKEQNERLEERVAEQIAEISAAHMATIFALVTLAEYRDNDTGRHIERVSLYSRILATQLRHSGMSREIDSRFISNLYHAAPMHDIGKVGISDAILLKPGKLTDEEFDTIKNHTVLGAQTLLQVHTRYPRNDFIRMGMDVARWHHERWNSTGYPDGLQGTDIPLSARIMAVVDVYDALRSNRPYKKPYSHTRSAEILIAQSGVQFDPMVVDAFLSVEKEFEQLSAHQQ
jgi:putative two-component system response regulator